MNAAVFIWARIGPNCHIWSCQKAATFTRRRDAIRAGISYTKSYRRVRVVFYPSKERIEWRDGVTQ